MKTDDHNPSSRYTRRRFLQTTAAAGASLALAPTVLSQEKPAPSKMLNVALIGAGRQGRRLLSDLLMMDGVRVAAICDIWPHASKLAVAVCREAKSTPNEYEDYRDLLEKERELDAAIVAVPDFLHAGIANVCLKAGLHVYCEAPMANTIKGAHGMARAARETGKLLQVGHQRRSNPYYLHTQRLINMDGVLGQITQVRGQWNQRIMPGSIANAIAKNPLPRGVLARYGFRSAWEYCNWRLYRRYAAGLLANRGSHQLDVFKMVLGRAPAAVYAVGDGLKARAQAREQAWAQGWTSPPDVLDHALALFDWGLNSGPVRGFYQVNLRTSHGGIYEEFMGEKGSLTISTDTTKNKLFKEPNPPVEWVDEVEKLERGDDEKPVFKPRRTPPRRISREFRLKMQAERAKWEYQAHLKNFFDAIRDGGKTQLACPPAIGLEVLVTAIKADESATTGKRIVFKPADFIA